MRRHLNETSSYTAPLNLHFSFIFKDTKKKFKKFYFFRCCCFKKDYKDRKEEWWWWWRERRYYKQTNQKREKRSTLYFCLWFLKHWRWFHFFPLCICVIMTPELLLTREPIIIIIIDQLWRGVVNISWMQNRNQKETWWPGPRKSRCNPSPHAEELHKEIRNG